MYLDLRVVFVVLYMIVYLWMQCVYLCVTVSMQADVFFKGFSVSGCGPHGLSETDRISISLAVGLYSSMGTSVCMCVYAWGSFCVTISTC